MDPSRLSEFNSVLQIARSDRWQVCHRLTELGIVANCSKEGGLAIQLRSPTDLWQVRSVLQQFTAPRQQLVQLLTLCWEMTSAE